MRIFVGLVDVIYIIRETAKMSLNLISIMLWSLVCSTIKKKNPNRKDFFSRIIKIYNSANLMRHTTKRNPILY